MLLKLGIFRGPEGRQPDANIFFVSQSDPAALIVSLGQPRRTSHASERLAKEEKRSESRGLAWEL